MRKFIMVAGLVAGLSGVARADVADREHLDAAIANLTAQINALSDKVESYGTATINGMPECPDVNVTGSEAPRAFRLYRTTKTGKEKARRFILRAE